MLMTAQPAHARQVAGLARNAFRRMAGLAVRVTILSAALVLLSILLCVRSASASSRADPSEHHHHIAPETLRTLADYSIPRVALVREDGKNVILSNEIDDGEPVVLSFVYTTCSTVCPVTSMTMAELQARLGAARDRVHLVSISIDPEQDTPARLRDYARRFGAGPGWHHYTGTVGASVASQRAFGVYRGDKMSHVPVTLVRTGPNARWVRIEGFATADQLLAELRPAVGAQ